MKKVIHIITGLQQAGAETILYRLITADDKSNHIVISLTDLGYYGPLLLKYGVEVYELKLSLYNFLLKTIKFVNILRAHTDSTVHCWMYHSNLYGGVLAKILGFRNVIWSVHHLNSSSLKGSTRIVSKFCSILSRFLPSKIIYVSEESLKYHVKDGYDEDISKVVHNFVDTNIFKPSKELREKFRDNLNISQDVFVFGSVARWHPIKGHSTILRSFSELIASNPDLYYKLVLVGPGISEDNKELIMQLEELAISENVILLGASPNLEEIYPGFDVHILASINEAFGMVTLEALSCGVPVISSDVGFAHRFISDSKALFEPGDSQQLLDSMIYSSHSLKFSNIVKLDSEFTILVALAKYYDIWFY